MLKVNFPVTVHSEDALHDIQFGHVRRPTHDSMEYDAARFEVCNHKWTALAEEGRGAAVLNDSKYGVDVEENSINLTLSRAPLAPDMTADLGVQAFTYAFQCWNHAAFRDAGVEVRAFNRPSLSDPYGLLQRDRNFANYQDIQKGDVIECYEVETLKRSL